MSVHSSRPKLYWMLQEASYVVLRHSLLWLSVSRHMIVKLDLQRGVIRQSSTVWVKNVAYNPQLQYLTELRQQSAGSECVTAYLQVKGSIHLDACVFNPDTQTLHTWAATHMQPRWRNHFTFWPPLRDMGGGGGGHTTFEPHYRNASFLVATEFLA